ncbi:MAG: ATP-binding cassette domain-containing protein [Paludibacteraceae bacterium]|nr:ATP-binding cassette domain-containing protein [Paludibacteraceae bacterium]
MVSVEQISMEFSARAVLEDVSFQINAKEKIALVGKNGAGKSTLLKILAGRQVPTSGKVVAPKEMKVGYLPQHLLTNDERTVREEAELAFEDVLRQRKRVEELSNRMAEREDYDSQEYLKLIEELTHATERLQMMGGDECEAELEKTLMGLGFTRGDFDRRTSEFSGGWRMRVELAKILLGKPDLLLLDEPTNHLDIESIEWFEGFLKTSGAAVVLVSHDRAFINRVTGRTIEISLGRIFDYKVSYDEYVTLRAERREQQLRAYRNQQKMIAETEDFIERFRYKATKSVQVQSRIKQLAKLQMVEVDEEDTSALNLRFPPSPRSGQIPVEIEGLSKSYGNVNALENVSLIINRGEKVAFVGKNGEGKSTLVKCIMNEIGDYTGKLKIGHNVQIGYFAQNQASLLDGEITVFDTIDRVAVGDVRTKIRDILAAFMFKGEDIEKKVKVLSGGERSRLAMIRLLLSPVNLLILDEPTNHLDMASKDVLKRAIREFDGTAIVVSHDRDFLDGLVDKIYEFKNHRIREYIGGIYEFLNYKRMENLDALNATARKEEGSGLNAESTEKKKQNQLSYEQHKQAAREMRKLQKQVEEVEKEIEKIDVAIKEIEGELSNPEKAQDAELFQRYERLKREQEQKMYEWEILSESVQKSSNEGVVD